ncbi:MAG: hypothetical protein ABR562_09070 [Thermoplasmatota archaeon]
MERRLTALALALLAFALAVPALGNALPGLAANRMAYPGGSPSPFADDYPPPVPPAAPPSAVGTGQTVAPPLPASQGDAVTAGPPDSSASPPPVGSRIAAGEAPVPQILDADGKAVGPAVCNQGQGPSGPTTPIQFCCPKTLTPFGTDGTGAAGDRYDYRTCPFRIYDSRSGVTPDDPTAAPTTYRFGNPQIAVNRNDEREVAFCSLHGDAVKGQGVTPRTRVSNQAQTTFTSSDQGITWQDQPPLGTPGLGESASCTMDSKGRIYIGYLYSRDNGNAETGYGSNLWLVKAGTAREPGSVLNGYGGGAQFSGRTPMNPIPALNVIDIPPFVQPPPMANQTFGPPADETEEGKSAIDDGNATTERVGAVWFERCTEYARNVTDPCKAAAGMPGWIDAAFTDVGPSDAWRRLTDKQLIGPCMDASNPVQFDGNVYVACVVERGYNARSRARIGDVDIWRIDPQTGNSTVVESTGLSGGHPLLASTARGYMVLVTSRYVGGSGARVEAAFGWYGRGWSSLGVDMGPELHRLAGSVPVRDAGVNALSISETEKTSILEYMEWQNVTKPGELPPPQPLDPTNPLAATPALKDFKKIFMTFNSCNAPIAAARMELGTGVDPDNFDAYTEKPSIFDDSQDGIQSYAEPGGGDLFYFAVNDYGAMQYGAVLTSAASSLCIVPPPIGAPPPLPIPQALTVTNGAVAQVGAVVGVTAIAGVLYLVTAKRRATHLAVAEAK